MKHSGRQTEHPYWSWAASLLQRGERLSSKSRAGLRGRLAGKAIEFFGISSPNTMEKVLWSGEIKVKLLCHV